MRSATILMISGLLYTIRPWVMNSLMKLIRLPFVSAGSIRYLTKASQAVTSGVQQTYDTATNCVFQRPRRSIFDLSKARVLDHKTLLPESDLGLIFVAKLIYRARTGMLSTKWKTIFRLGCWHYLSAQNTDIHRFDWCSVQIYLRTRCMRH